MYGWARLNSLATSSWVPWKVGKRLNKGQVMREAARVNAEPSKVRCQIDMMRKRKKFEVVKIQKNRKIHPQRGIFQLPRTVSIKVRGR